MTEAFLHSFLNTIFLICKNSSLQFAASFGLLFVSGLLLSFISRWISNSFQQFAFPRFGLYLFGVVGVPIHEFCHALFAKIFFHNITKIKWFDPKGKGGSNGSVTHYYQEKNLYHRIGLFFIGMGPVLLAPALLFAAYSIFVPGAHQVALLWSSPGVLLEKFSHSLLSTDHLTSLGFYLFVYFAVCLTSQMELSPDDLKIARGGGLPFFLLLLVANSLAAIFKYNLHAKLASMFHLAFLLWSASFIIAVLLSLANLLLCFLGLNLINRLMGQASINPFRRS